MKQIIGFALFFIGVGMIVKMFIDNVFLSVCIILGLLVLGYNLFMSCNCNFCCEFGQELNILKEVQTWLSVLFVIKALTLVSR